MFSIGYLHKLLHNTINCPEQLNEKSFYVACRSENVFYCIFNRTAVMAWSPVNVMCCNFNNLLTATCRISFTKLYCDGYAQILFSFYLYESSLYSAVISNCSL